jgi:hypothetical protein
MPPRLMCSAKRLSGVRSVPAIPRRSLRTPPPPVPTGAGTSCEKMAKSRQLNVIRKAVGTILGCVRLPGRYAAESGPIIKASPMTPYVPRRA